MNRFDDEVEIIRLVQNLDIKKFVKLFSSISARNFFKSLHSKDLFENWVDSSGKNQIPPDFYSDEYKYMLEVMRIDDYELGKNSPNALESKKFKEIINQIGIDNFNQIKEHSTFIIIPNLENSSEHNYKIYLQNFKRIVEDHNKKVKDYRKNHPGYKLGFLIFDESTGCIVPQDSTISPKCGDAVLCKPHWFWLDKDFLNVLIKCDVDYIFWITPFKNIENNKEIFPYGSIIDVKKLRRKKYKTIKYNFEDIRSIEL